MAPSKKAKAAGVSASSFLDLKAELAKKEEEFAKNKVQGKSTALVGGVKRPDKKPTVWSRPNKGVDSRAMRDIDEVSKPTLESARAILERKAQIYDKLRKGKTGGLSDAHYDALLVDFDSKGIDAYEGDSDDEDESLTVPKPPQNEEDDPIVEYEDEFGRARTGRRSEIPRHLLKKEEEEEIDPFIIYNPEGYFPTYQPSEERLAAIREEFSEENNPLNVHYDASQEVRAKGGAFYQFSGDEETRKRQMEELKKAREETGKTREEIGAVDTVPGEVEGMTAPVAAEQVLPKSRALEKRKRELEERRKLLDAKRRKKDTGSSSNVFYMPPEPSSSPSPGPHLPDQPPAPEADHAISPRAPAPVDPFAALELQSRVSSRKGKEREKEAPPIDPADAFLANLEKDILQKSKR